MILPLGALSLDRRHFPNLYGMMHDDNGRMEPRKSAISPLSGSEVRDMVTLSPAAQRILDQAERLQRMQLSVRSGI